jgi:succinate-semialdehyde dehydrogenase / glutarate-semialdehyde dehydrogenase
MEVAMTKISYPELRLLIGNEWLTRSSGEPVINPADEEIIGIVPHATAADLDAAVAAAQQGFRIWRRTAPAQRAQVMQRAVELIRERTEAIALVMTLEQGKPLAQSRLEVQRACEIIEWDATEGRRIYGRVIPSEPGMRHTVLREPIGVVAAFSPWNFPFSSPSRKVAGALASGCAVILKASEETPGCAMMLAQAFVDAGLPAGVLNLVLGKPAEISSHLIAQPAVRLVTFTGSVPVGKHLAALCGTHMKPAIMELGGHAPVIICDDADPVAAARACVISKSRNSGQVCVAPTRFLVHDSIYDRFAETFAEQASAVTLGNGLDPSVQMGPLANGRRMDAIHDLVSDAVAKGARCASGGVRQGNRGFFYPLTTLNDIPGDARAMTEEPFGPLALLVRVASIDQAIGTANALPFGLSAYAFTESARNAERLAEGIECGNLAINHFTASFAETPFGGVKDSGYGREGGTEGLQCYTVAKLVSHKVAA